MQISISNFRKIESADINVDKLSIVAAVNGGGKSSIAQAVRAAITRNPSVLGIKKMDMGAIIHDGAKDAVITISQEAETVGISWPKCTLSETSPTALRSSELAAGAITFTSLKTDDAAKLLSGILRSDPNREEVVAALIPIVGDNERAESIASIVFQKGWDAALNEIKDGVRSLKGQWEGIAGEKYGSQKAVNWQPAIFEGKLIVSTEEDLLAVLAESQAEYDRVIQQTAVSAEKVRNLIKQAKDEQITAQQLEQAIKEADALELEVSALQRRVQDEKVDSTGSFEADTFACPHCEGIIAKKSKNGQTIYAKPDVVESEEDKAAQKKRRLEYASLCGEHENKKAKLATARKVVARCQVELEQQKAAAKQLETMGFTVDSEVPDNTADIERARLGMAIASDRLAAFRGYKKANEIHARIAAGEKVAEELEPSGIRYRKLVSQIQHFNKRLAELSKHINIEPVNLDTDMQVYSGRRHYKFLSESTKFRVDVVLQTAFAIEDNSSLVVIDGADIVLGADRLGLVNMLMAANVRALFCIALAKPESLPQIWTVPGGAAYWIENSKTQRIG